MKRRIFFTEKSFRSQDHRNGNHRSGRKNTVEDGWLDLLTETRGEGRKGEDGDVGMDAGVVELPEIQFELPEFGGLGLKEEEVAALIFEMATPTRVQGCFFICLDFLYIYIYITNIGVQCCNMKCHVNNRLHVDNLCGR